ncbi:MAG TPA: branched-chain amino acid ABC transporter permease [Casimicrobiaceae bacterium]
MIASRRNLRFAGAIVFWIALVTLPLWLTHVGGYTALGTKILVYGIATLALNLLLGFTGGLSFGHAAWFGLGAYGAGMTLKYLAPSTPLAILVGTVAGGIAATVLGPLVMRRRGIYFAMITIAIGQLFYFVAVRWNNVTGGEDGLAGFERAPLHFGKWVYDIHDDTKYYYLVLVCFAVAVVVMKLLLASPLGHTWVAIRENRRRLQFLGVRIDLYVWAAFAISGTLTALAGTLNALLFNFTSPQDLHWILSGNFVIMIVLGGMRKFWGPLLGVAIFVVAQDYLSSVTDNWMTAIGMLFVLIVLLFPKGLLGMLGRRGKEAA